MDRIPVEDYAERIAALLDAPLRPRTVEVGLEDTLGRVLADAVASPLDLPPFRNSQMDGYALRARDLPSEGGEIAVVATTAAGESAAELPAGAAVKVMTGAPLPGDADAVVPVEHAEPAGAGRIRVLRPVVAGAYVRERGEDLTAGTVILPEGTRMASRHLAALAAAGITRLPVRDRVRVAVISTGRELVDPGAPLGAGQLPDANGIALSTAAASDGATVVRVARVGDDPTELADEIARARGNGADLVITSGGISMGDFEPVRALLAEHGGTTGTVDMQPGGPQAHGVVLDMPIIGFPGNPVSAQVSYALFLGPLLRRAAGLPPARRSRMPLAASIRLPPGRRRFVRAVTTPEGVAPIGGTGSHLVSAMAAADVLLDLPSAVGDLPVGALVDTVEL